MNVFEKQAEFISAMGQKGDPALYAKLVTEEYQEVQQAYDTYLGFKDAAKLAHLAQECVDLIYVTAGLLNSLGIDGAAVFNEVHRSNMSKMGPDGKAIRREDGKILKPETYTPPNLLPLMPFAEAEHELHLA